MPEQRVHILLHCREQLRTASKSLLENCQDVSALSGMEGTKGEERQPEPAAALFGTSELESQMISTVRRKKRNHCCKIIIGVALLCLLIVIVIVAISLKNGSKSTAYRTTGEYESPGALPPHTSETSPHGEEGEEGGGLWKKFSHEIGEAKCPPGFSKSPLLLVSLDGFRGEYLKDHKSRLPIINKLRKDGTTTSYMRPVYPTKTFPNHYSIVTGLYPESHGIVDNKMYDVTRNAFFSLKTEEKWNSDWYQGEPVWLTAMRQKLKAASFFWPGSDVAINGSYPNIYKIYDGNIKFENRLKTVFEWLNLPKQERPDFYTLYLDEPDTTGHAYGPKSSQVVAALEKIDTILGNLMDGLYTRDLHQCVNLMIVSDHGMEEASCQRAAYVSTYQQDTSNFTVIQGPAGRIRPKRLPQDYFSFDYEGLIKNLSCRVPDQPMRPYLKENLPKRMHFASNKRIERAHLYMKQGWQAALTKSDVKYCTGGFHGSDNLFTNMQAIFIGYGPGFKSKYVAPTFENIELYNLMCDLLGIRPSPNNGTHGSLNHLLKHPVHHPVHPAQLSHETPCESTNLVPTDNLHCLCSSQSTEKETEMNRILLSINSETKAKLRRLHHPFGTPGVVQPGNNFCLLFHADYLSGYSWDRLLPLWVSYTLQPLSRVRTLGPDGCIRVDFRVPSSSGQLCILYRDEAALSYGLLHPPYLNATGSETDSLISSNMAPMYPAFKKVWSHFHTSILLKYSQELNGVNIVSGPIFDADFDGNVDPVSKSTGNDSSVPTHFFLIMTSCRNSSLTPVNCEGPLQAIAFIMPHKPDYSEFCAAESDLSWVEEWLRFHIARVRDIELLTGLSFYHGRISVEETIQLKTFLHTV
ncbi:ectonucleotide pyrophosphatase/phosphodiesterase family member 1 isoform X1 [Gambusia affinis]|uniref:ectonucleotide pyrophosphatase/phosphodiesterase family member 1 isoform X1 n=1 Tax=Gambusia affinis TaxID=33528 RepID=UPI001CDBED55|nr:ectonucleotide pyrophosphatase/phosphodiesterase family member 1 isoform X1 [Gambusia affinis]